MMIHFNLFKFSLVSTSVRVIFVKRSSRDVHLTSLEDFNIESVYGSELLLKSLQIANMSKVICL
jgi:hypothetical protein